MAKKIFIKNKNKCNQCMTVQTRLEAFSDWFNPEQHGGVGYIKRPDYSSKACLTQNNPISVKWRRLQKAFYIDTFCMTKITNVLCKHVLFRHPHLTNIYDLM